ncbi:Sushi, nidogen and EGF-like domain-containing protein 1 [Geodia barretti]|uniref:Sushi, nidogen and EGF-like domain-containing protein 1 n=1 Tax=Geodia barretti TaxID=519541 RepID=A0AA35XAW6_GEOBA|nr:Sushi, nidogen and EGF-like domain-containing protein 1 [Geodia barretti]
MRQAWWTKIFPCSDREFMQQPIGLVGSIPFVQMWKFVMLCMQRKPSVRKEMQFFMVFSLLITLCCCQCNESFPGGLIPYGDDCVDDCLDGTKERSCNDSRIESDVTEKQPLDVNYTFYGQNYSSVYICENGLISFEDCEEFCKNQTDLKASSVPVIAGIWQDIFLFRFYSSDATYKVPYAYYKERMNNTGCFNESKKKVEEHLCNGFGERLDFNLTHVFSSTWHGIGNTSGTIQIVIATDENKPDTYALLIYDDWNVTEEQRMQIGFSAGCDEKYFPLSSIAGTSNIGVPGVYAFRIDQRDIIDPSKGVDCGDLPDPQNGKVKYTSTILNSLANYTCTADCDFMLTRECLPDGSWSGKEPECPDIVCRGLEKCHPENGWLSLISGSQGLVAEYGCELGYIPNNTRDTRHCKCGSWSGDEIHCVEMCPNVGQDKTCGEHSLILACDSRKDRITNSSILHLNGSYEFFQEPLSSLQASKQQILIPPVKSVSTEHAPCHGRTFYHFPVNPLHVTSQDIGISGAYILRIDETPGGIHCNCSIDEIVNPANGEADIINTLRASWGVYDCRSGFSLTGDNPRQCINGVWMGTAPECKRRSLEMT